MEPRLIGEKHENVGFDQVRHERSERVVVAEESELRERGFVRLDEAHLSDGGGGLQLVHRPRPRSPPEALDSLGDGTGRHEHRLLPTAPEIGDLRCPARDGCMIEPATVVGEEARAYLDDDACGGGEGRGHVGGARLLRKA